MTEQRRPLISGNWKMNLNHFEAIKLVQELSYAVSRDDVDAVDISLHVPFTDVRTVQTVLEADKIPFFLGAQHCHFEASGAFTGEISPTMLAKLNVAYVLVGHSERRQLFGEDNEMCNAKIKAIIAAEMTPILCVGETLEERESGDAETVVTSQIEEGLKGVKAESLEGFVLAYEPIWAIGTGKTATAADAQNMCAHARRVFAKLYTSELADSLRVQYGGSVKPANAAELLTQPDIDGALVGGASLDATSFAKIVQYRLAE